MSIYKKRAQTMLTDKQYEMLGEIAEKEKKPVSVLIREAIEKTYLADAEMAKRKVALESLLSLNAPVADWEQIEKEIEKGMLGEQIEE